MKHSVFEPSPIVEAYRQRQAIHIRKRQTDTAVHARRISRLLSGGTGRI